MGKKKDKEKQEEPKAEAKEDQKPDEPEEPTKKKSSAIYNVILVIGIILVAAGTAYVALKYLKDWRDAKMYQDTVDTYVTVNESTQANTAEPTDDGVVVDAEDTEEATEIMMDPDIPWYEQISVNFDELNNVNPDIVAWIYQENGSISYPVLYSGDNEKYLRETYLGVEATAGSIFVGGYNNPDFNDPLTMVYGHNMNNGTMFGSLKKYRNEPEPDYYNGHQYFQIYTEDGMAYRYQVYAYFNVADTDLEMEYVDFDNPDNDITYEDYLNTIASRDVLGSGIEVTTDDKVLGLWTCANYGTKRFLVFAVQVDSHDFNALE
ncbi:MAG: class B sortase [Clostridiales bacterium]|nr:class B sortase [Clostridiales bacterium]